MDGRDFIALAGRLAVSLGAEEANYRTSISRAYYGAFHAARNFLLELGFEPLHNANVHAFVRNYLYESGQPDARVAARDLANLQSARNKADYDLDDAATGAREFAMRCVEQAHRVVTALDACRSDAAREPMRQAIAEYERRVRPR
jgi:uncharacterized protein (UPF0332 family)